ERVNVREEIARLIHDVNRTLPIRNADVHMQTEDEIGASELLHVLDDLLISLALSNKLIAPVRKRMRHHRGNLQSAATCQFRDAAAQLNHVSTRIDNRLANFSA